MCCVCCASYDVYMVCIVHAGTHWHAHTLDIHSPQYYIHHNHSYHTQHNHSHAYAILTPPPPQSPPCIRHLPNTTPTHSFKWLFQPQTSPEAMDSKEAPTLSAVLQDPFTWAPCERSPLEARNVEGVICVFDPESGEEVFPLPGSATSFFTDMHRYVFFWVCLCVSSLSLSLCVCVCVCVWMWM